MAWREASDLGSATSALVVANTMRMAAGGMRDRRAEDGSATARTPGRLLSAEPLFLDRSALDGSLLDEAAAAGSEPVGLRCHFAESELEVRFVRDDVVRLTWGSDDPPIPWALAAPLGLSSPTGPVSVTTGAAARGGVGPARASQERDAGDSDGPACSAATASMRVVVSPDGEVRIFGAGGALLRHELPPLRRGATRTVRQMLRTGERVAGLGEQASPVDLRGTTHRLWNRDPGGAWGPGQDPLYCAFPVMVGLHPDGDVLVFHDNPYEALVRIDGVAGHVGTRPRAEVTFTGGALVHYVVAGPLPRLLDRYSELTGRPPLPPRWALGYHQCKWGYKSDADVREVADGFRDEGVPLSAVHLDIDYMDGYRVFTIDPQRFPDLAGLVGHLGARGTRVVTIVDPAVKADPGYEVFRDGSETGRFLLDSGGEPLLGVVWPGRAAFPDFTDPETRHWWAGWYQRLLDAGVAGVWHDMNEPTSLTLWGDRTLPLGTRHSAEGLGGDHRQCHNVYGLLMDRTGWEALAAGRPERRPFVLSRSGWAGLQRWAWNWTADVESSWGALRQQVATTIGLGLSGVPYTGSDIGGFSGVPSPELFTRWLELSVLMPFCRTHSVIGSPSREPWRFPEPYRSAIGRLIGFRYRILPYLYTLAYEASRSGTPLVRPLCWPPPDGVGSGGSSADPRMWRVDDAYLLGDSILVAPVTEEGGQSRTVPLPAGRWYRWRALPEMAQTGEMAKTGDPSPAGGDQVTVVEGGRTVQLDAPVGQPLVLVREGTVLPLDDGWADSGSEGSDAGGGMLTPGHEPRLPAFHCFPGADGVAAGDCYDDSGDGDGPSRVDRIRLVVHGPAGGPGRDAVVSWEREGAYGLPARVRLVVHGLAASRATVDGEEVDAVVTTLPGREPITAVDCSPFTELHLGS